jgi:predicted nuclease of predicted toxin-antitoxin system
MIFLCDVHISFKLVKTIENMGFICVHVNSILDKWHTKDEDIMSYVDKNNMILISKDSDFKNSHFIKNSPKKLIKINLGNISNVELNTIIVNIFPEVTKTNSEASNFIIEINKEYSTITKS